MPGVMKRIAVQDQTTTSKRTRTLPRRTQPPASTDDQDRLNTPATAEGDHVDEDKTLSSIREGISSYSRKLGKKDDWAEVFRQKLVQTETEVLEEICEVKTVLVDGREAFKQRFAKIMAKALLPPDVELELWEEGRPLRVEYPMAKCVKLCQNGETLLGQSTDLLETYKRICATENPESRLGGLRDAFERDKTAAIEVIEAGRKVAQRDVEYMLADGNHEVRGSSSLTVDDEEKGMMVMTRGKGDNGEDSKDGGRGWGVVALDAYRAVDRLARIVEVDD